MRLEDFDYNLPTELIAQDPLLDRAASRLLIMDKETGELTHGHFRDIVEFMHEGDSLVINDTKVIPARLLGIKEETGAKVEILLLKRLEDDNWETIVNPGKKLRVGAKVDFGDGLLKAEIIEVKPDGNRIVHFSYEGIFEEVLDKLGEMPLPPYITHKLEDKDRYQTVYAVHEGSAAAPTAGLHFTKDLLAKIEAKGVNIIHITLHVGLGTFRPVKEENIEEHLMHKEYYTVSPESATAINDTLRRGNRLFAVGTTSTRTIESAAVPNIEYEKLISEGYESVKYHGLNMIKKADGDFEPQYVVIPGSRETGIYIYPGYEWKETESLITNFHLPKSTLIMLVSALAGREHILNAYNEAVREKYRFFSFGDAMLIL